MHDTDNSIFGPTMQGVPNPMVPHRHPWPTRYHGPIYTVPGTANPTYVQRDMARTPYMGFGAVDLNVTGYPVVDAAAGGAVGYFMAKKKEKRIPMAIAGALTSYLAGWVGIAGTAAFALYDD